ncbi:hypothetical protein CYMTET_10410 [Cymbomonas tetramitiformis]|uniref:Uncharacterized protein n=1 Tax=Cymbomonas tetramitiformis TaxID=36881 RepID=A0AAE0GPA8_9CHLO|nr:hypothetical protein CYMTET_10410 [Cymbomonas tetramitiformis]
MLGSAFDVRCVSRILTVCYLLNRAEAPRVRVESRHSIAEHATPRVATYHCDWREELPVDPPEAVMIQWAAMLNAIKRAARLEASELRQLYGPGATASLIGAAHQAPPECSGQRPHDKTGLGATPSEDAPAMHDMTTSLSAPIQFVPASGGPTPALHASAQSQGRAPHHSIPSEKVARALSAAAGAREAIEPYDDEAMLRWLKGERHGDPALHPAASARARHYALEGETLIRILPNGARRPVPPVDQRRRIVQQMHERFGCPAEVVTDNGGEWEKDFAQLLRDNLIDHRTTSQSHPQSNGLSERVVQMIKDALTKACKQAGSIDRWDSFLPWIMLGYNATPQESTRLAPYELVYAQRPTLPPAIKERLSQPLDACMDAAAMAASYLERAEYVKRATIMAGSNIAIAQHRQTERYAQVRSGKYLPKQFNFRVGDFVFLKRSVNHGLQLHTCDPILQIKELPNDGTAVLQSRCGSTCNAHCSQIAICHLPDIDPTITYNLDDNEDARCQVCKKADRPASILLCDDCNQGYHLACLQPKLTRVPTEEFWYCPRCLGLLPDDDLSPQYLTAYENRGKQLDGKRALKVIDGIPYEGTIRWLGAAERPYALRCEYDDGDTETFTLAELQQYLLPDNATAAQKQAVAQPQLEAERALHTALAAIPDNVPNTAATPTPVPTTEPTEPSRSMVPGGLCGAGASSPAAHAEPGWDGPSLSVAPTEPNLQFAGSYGTQVKRSFTFVSSYGAGS